MHCDLDRRSKVVELQGEDVDQELGELEDPLRYGEGEGVQCVTGEQPRVVVAHHPGAGARGHHDRQVAVERSELPSRDRARLVPVAGVVGGLPAAALIRRKDHAHAGPADQLHAGKSCPRKQQVDETGPVKEDGRGSGRKDRRGHCRQV